MTRTLVAAALLLGLVGCREAHAAPKKTAPQILADVKKAYATVTDMSASFEQKVTNVTFGTTKTSDGQVWLRRPGKMRWDYNAPARKGKPRTSAKHFVSNGATLYLIDRENKELIKRTIADSVLPVAITFLYGQGDVTADFRAVLATREKDPAFASYRIIDANQP